MAVEEGSMPRTPRHRWRRGCGGGWSATGGLRAPLHPRRGAELFEIEVGEHVTLFTHLAEVRARVGPFLARAPPPGKA